MQIIDEIKVDPEKGTMRLVNEYRPRLIAAAFKFCQDSRFAEDFAMATLEKAVSRIAGCQCDDGLYHVIKGGNRWNYRYGSPDLCRPGERVFGGLVFSHAAHRAVGVRAVLER